MKDIISPNYSLRMAKQDSDRSLKGVSKRRSSRLIRAIEGFIDALTPIKGRSILIITGLSPLAITHV